MSQKQIGVIVNNLGTPDELSVPAIRRFLSEFLSDPFVVHLPRFIWYPILYGIILTLRPKKVMEAYASIWTEQGSPLKVMTHSLAEQLAHKLGDRYIVEVGMRYGRPNLEDAYWELSHHDVEKIIVLPLYPQYSISTTASVEAVMATLPSDFAKVPYQVITDYHQHPEYIKALAAQVKKHWNQHGRGERLLMSFHGIPVDFLRKGDPYFEQCQATAHRLAEALKLKSGEWQFCFQSRLGAAPWLQPYTDKIVEQLGKDGFKTLDVICPGFSIDCLETLEEIAVENAEIFREHGGSTLRYIPALNDSARQVKLMCKLVCESG